MGRRKREPEAVHRGNIFAAAKGLFIRYGIRAVTMEDIAKEAGYSKATLYVYFRDKEEIIDVMILESMRLLRDSLRGALAADNGGGARERYRAVCGALVEYQETQPLYFEMAIGEIHVDVESPDCLQVEREIVEAGEEINEELAGFLRAGIRSGEIRSDISVMETVFFFWAALAGVIQMGERKKQYFKGAMGVSKKQFLDYGFENLWRCIGAEVDA